MVRRFGISSPNVGFSLIVDGKKVIDVISEELDERIAALFDNTYKAVSYTHLTLPTIYSV